MDSYVVKVQNNGAIRRLTLGSGEKEFSYEQLRSRIRDIFQFAASAEFGLTYIDRDGDVVTMVEDEDLRDALVLQKLNPLRVSIENLRGGTNDVKVSPSPVQAELNSDEVAEQQQQSREAEQIALNPSKSLPVDPVANAETVINTDEDSTVSEEKEWTIVDEAPGSNSSDVTSPASETSVDSVKVDMAANTGPVVNSDENLTALEEKVSTIVDEVPDSNPPDDSSPASSTSVDATKETSPEGATKTDKKNLEAEEAQKDDWGHHFHFGVQCDGCGMIPIAGSRFKSCKKPNYDLCLKCYQASGAEENEYVKIDRSVYRIGCPAYAVRMFGRPQQRMCRRPDQCRNSTPDSEVKSFAADPTVESERKAAGLEKSTKVLHQGVQCDECGMVPIEGPRFRSFTRFNYDLCHSCFEKSGSNGREYTRIDQSFIRRGPHPFIGRGPNPLLMRHLMRWASPYRLEQPPSPSWVWVLNQLVPAVAADQVEAEEKTPAAGSDAKVGGDAVDKPQAESAASKVDAETAPSASNQEVGATKEQAEDVKVENKVVQIPVVWADTTEAASSSSPPETLSEKTGGVEEKAVEAPSAAEGDLSTQEGLLAKLAAMGFEDPKLNVELLDKNSFDLRKTLDDLCAAEEWDPVLGELQEMGFYDASLNRRLMFKHNGSVKRVVKELVQMYKGEKSA